jgi:hypothetical protein
MVVVKICDKLSIKAQQRQRINSALTSSAELLPYLRVNRYFAHHLRETLDAQARCQSVVGRKINIPIGS